MPQVQAKRRLVKSPPELWTELSDAAALARHLGEFGEIRITRLEPESKVVWEGERASGEVELDPAGWGTQVILRVELDEAAEAEPEPAAEPAAEEEPIAEAEPEPIAEAEPEPIFQPEPEPIFEPEPEALPSPASRPSFWSRLFGWAPADAQPATRVYERAVTEPEPEPEPVAPEPEPQPEPELTAPEPDPEPEPVAPGPPAETERVATLLEGVLDDLGSAHHRPFSRA